MTEANVRRPTTLLPRLAPPIKWHVERTPINASILIMILLASCSAPVPPGIVEEIKRLPRASSVDIFPPTPAKKRDTQINKATYIEHLRRYCFETGCNPNALAQITTFSETQDPKGQLKMETVPTGAGASMTIWNTNPITACDVKHEITHIDMVPRDAPDGLGEALGMPGKIRFDGFSFSALSMSEKKRALTLFEEAFADSMSLWMGLLAGEKCDVGYGEIGYLMLSILEKGGIPYREAIKLHQTSDLVGLLSRLTGVTDHEINFLFFTKVYTLFDKLKNKEMTLENAIKEYEKVSNAFKRKGTFKGNEFAQFFNENATSVEMMDKIDEYATSLGTVLPEEVYQYLPKLKKKDSVIGEPAGTITFVRKGDIPRLGKPKKMKGGGKTNYSTRHTLRSNRRRQKH